MFMYQVKENHQTLKTLSHYLAKSKTEAEWRLYRDRMERYIRNNLNEEEKEAARRCGWKV